MPDLRKAAADRSEPPRGVWRILIRLFATLAIAVAAAVIGWTAPAQTQTDWDLNVPLVVGLPNRVSEDQGHLKVPPVVAQPMISGAEAIALAWNDRPPGGAKTVAASLAMLDDSDLTEDGSLLVWVVHYEGACIRSFGPSISGSSELSCEPTDWTVVIDAATGSFVQAYN